MEGLDERLASLIAPLEQELEQLGAHRVHLIEEREQVDRDISRINRVLKPLRGEDTPKKKVARTAAKKGGGGISEDRIDLIEAAIRDLITDDTVYVTIPLLDREMDISRKSIESGVRVLRERQVIRRAGRADNNGERGIGPYQYALMTTEGVKDNGRGTRQPA